MTRNTANDYAPAYSAINSTIAFVTEREDRRGIWTIDAASGAETALAAAAGAVGAPSWSPDGAKVVYNVIASNRSDLILDGRAITSNEDVFPFRAQWTSPSELIYTADGKIKKRSIQGAERKVASEAIRASWAPRGSEIAYVTRREGALAVTGRSAPVPAKIHDIGRPTWALEGLIAMPGLTPGAGGTGVALTGGRVCYHVLPW